MHFWTPKKWLGFADSIAGFGFMLCHGSWFYRQEKCCRDHDSIEIFACPPILYYRLPSSGRPWNSQGDLKNLSQNERARSALSLPLKDEQFRTAATVWALASHARGNPNHKRMIGANNMWLHEFKAFDWVMALVPLRPASCCAAQKASIIYEFQHVHHCLRPQQHRLHLWHMWRHTTSTWTWGLSHVFCYFLMHVLLSNVFQYCLQQPVCWCMSRECVGRNSIQTQYKHIRRHNE